MEKIKLHVDYTSYKTKPVNQHGLIKPRLQGARPVELTVDEIIQKIERGHTVSPAVLEGGLGAANWKEQQLFLVDIDNDIEGEPMLRPDEALKICHANDIAPAFYYPTFSHTELKPKFRLAFICKEVITEAGMRAAIIEGITGLFAQADKSCKNADKMFLGTNQKAVICDVTARFASGQAINAYTPIEQPTPNHATYGTDSELERLKRDFDFLSYLIQRNDGLKYNNSKTAMFRACEICGGHDDLALYHASNSFMCFGARGNRGGSIIDYLMLTEHLDKAAAIKKFKYELCGLTEPTFTKTQKRDYAISKHI